MQWSLRFLARRADVEAGEWLIVRIPDAVARIETPLLAKIELSPALWLPAIASFSAALASPAAGTDGFSAAASAASCVGAEGAASAAAARGARERGGGDLQPWKQNQSRLVHPTVVLYQSDTLHLKRTRPCSIGLVGMCIARGELSGGSTARW